MDSGPDRRFFRGLAAGVLLAVALWVGIAAAVATVCGLHAERFTTWLDDAMHELDRRALAHITDR